MNLSGRSLLLFPHRVRCMLTATAVAPLRCFPIPSLSPASVCSSAISTLRWSSGMPTNPVGGARTGLFPLTGASFPAAGRRPPVSRAVSGGMGSRS